MVKFGVQARDIRLSFGKISRQIHGDFPRMRGLPGIEGIGSRQLVDFPRMRGLPGAMRWLFIHDFRFPAHAGIARKTPCIYSDKIQITRVCGDCSRSAPTTSSVAQRFPACVGIARKKRCPITAYFRFPAHAGIARLDVFKRCLNTEISRACGDCSAY
jgi:hypothetical protein